MAQTQEKHKIELTEWKSLVKPHPNEPQASFLEFEDPEAVLEEYNRLVDTEFPNNERAKESLKVFNYDPKNKVITGSNDFAPIFLYQRILKPLGLRIATQTDLEKALDLQALPLRGQYEDSGLVSRTNGDSYKNNNAIAKDFFAKIKHRGKKASQEVPLMVPLIGLDIEASNNNGYGLVYIFTNETQIIEAPQLNHENNEKTYSKTNEHGLAEEFDEEGDETQYTRKDGFSRFFVDGILYRCSDGQDLANSNRNGRVVVVRGEATCADKLRSKYEQKKSELSRASKSQLREAQKLLEKGYQEALEKLSK